MKVADEVAGLAARLERERAAAEFALADLPLSAFLSEPLTDPVPTPSPARLDSHAPAAFAPVHSLPGGEFREWLLDDATRGEWIAALKWGITPEMVAAVAKLMGKRFWCVCWRRCG